MALAPPGLSQRLRPGAAFVLGQKPCGLAILRVVRSPIDALWPCPRAGRRASRGPHKNLVRSAEAAWTFVVGRW